MNAEREQPNGSPAPDKSPPPRKTIITPDTGSLSLIERTVELWATSSFARAWFSDAQREASITNDADARRREIVFAVCLAESYLFEWVRDEVLARRYAELNKYFLPRTRTSLLARYKNVTQALVKESKLLRKPDWERKLWKDFQRLVTMRNGLVHATASRPDSAKLLPEEKPYPKSEELAMLEAGWATKSVTELIVGLHRAAGTTPPSWLRIP